ncbi:hypothetical protein AMTR_s00068p00180820 [Amborella trichopoda]|uniref:DNA-directed RNA polymerase n=1 Tax=Amborella trichopoda TaxID=13333 RepID=U5DIT6_AMBTC|nr:hypothetical protein AMTR_s00068p00180820 [Amborella trichopoda]
MIPFPDHNQSPRNTYQSAMGEQAMGIYVTNYQLRMLKNATVSDHTFAGDVPNRACIFAECYCCNCLLFRIQPRGFCYHESVFHRSGLFRSLLYHSYRDEEKKTRNLFKEEFGRPNRWDTMDMGHGSYDKLDADGLPSPGTKVSADDAIIGKTIPVSRDQMEGQASCYKRRDCSTILSFNKSGIVDQVLLTTNVEGLRFVKVRVRSVHIPQIGDKFSSSMVRKELWA